MEAAGSQYNIHLERKFTLESTAEVLQVGKDQEWLKRNRISKNGIRKSPEIASETESVV